MTHNGSAWGETKAVVWGHYGVCFDQTTREVSHLILPSDEIKRGEEPKKHELAAAAGTITYFFCFGQCLFI